MGTLNVMKMSRTDLFHMIAFVLLFIGGINWGLIGMFQINLIAKLLGAMTTLSKTLYILVGVASIYYAFTVVRRGKA